MYGIGYFYIMGGIITMGFVMMSVFLPVFHDLKLTSTYQVKSNVINPLWRGGESMRGLED